MDRRNFLKILGITSSTAVVSSCGVDKAHEKIIPYVVPPEEDVYPGKPLFYNSTCTECPANCGITVKVHEKVYDGNRGLFPTKLDGVAGHPVNDGALCMRGQAGLFRLYHPERIKRPMMRDAAGKLRVATWPEALEKIQIAMNSAKSAAKRNVYFAGLRNGALSDMLDEFCKKSGAERLPAFELINHAQLRRANAAVFGQADIPFYNIEKADYLLSIGADIVETFVSPVSFSAQLEKARQKNDLKWMHAEPNASLSGVQADHRLALTPGSESIFLNWLISELAKNSALLRRLPSEILAKFAGEDIQSVARKCGLSKNELLQVAEALMKAKTPLIIAGGVYGASINAAAFATTAALLQYALKMDENTLDFSRSESWEQVGGLADVKALLGSLNAKEVGVLFVSGIDPQKQLAGKLEVAKAFGKAQLRVGLSETMNSTVSDCDVILPLSHTLEDWGEAEPRRGVLSAIQPAIEAQYDSLSEGEVFLKLLGAKTSWKDYLFSRWHRKYGEAGTQAFLQKGFKVLPAQNTRLKFNKKQVLDSLQITGKAGGGHTLFFTPSIRSYDGRSTILPLLREVPDPISTVTYGEWVSVSPEDAETMQLRDGDELQLNKGDFSLSLPARIQIGQPAGSFSIQIDQVSKLPLNTVGGNGEFLTTLNDISVNKTGQSVPIPILSGSYDEDGRGMLPPQEDAHGHHGMENTSLYEEHEHDTYRWGMAIDLNSCIGCNACSAACYVENNVPIVGKEEHLKGREMSWIRIQPYIDTENIIEFVPVLCQHCDDAPCESVCPVYAAYHNPEGLNVQVYNRCVGTRYCANNCPYKVRRFNWFDHRLVEPWDKMYNPEVSVRTRGIMEKCSFCIHKIRHAKDVAKDENRIVQDGEVVPACAQTCPTNAITFGNMLDKKSAVYQKAHSDDAYRLLEEVGTQPAVHYIKKSANKEKAAHGTHA